MSLTAFILNGLPKECASIMAFVLGLIAASILLTSTLCVVSSMSTNTGTAPNCSTGFTVVGNPAATPITSSPGLMARSPSLDEVSVLNANRFAEEPEFVVIKNLTPKYFANRFSNASLNRPVVSHPSNDASTIFFSSVASSTLPDGGTTVTPGSKILGVY